MTEMVERVARAICDCDAAGLITWSGAQVVARAAIEAMREPTYEMLESGIDAFQHAHCSVDRLSDWRANYRAMIDAALK